MQWQSVGLGNFYTFFIDKRGKNQKAKQRAQKDNHKDADVSTQKLDQRHGRAKRCGPGQHPEYTSEVKIVAL